MEAIIVTAVTALCAALILHARARQMAACREAALMACKRTVMRRDLADFVRRERAEGVLQAGFSDR